MSNPPALPDARENLARALTLGAVLLCAVYIVVRPLANQFDYYSGEAAFAGLVLCLLGAVCGAIFLLQRGTALPTRVALATVLWAGLLFWGAVHSPHQGKGIPYAADFGGYILLMLCGYVLAQRDRRIFPLVCRLLIAMALVEACSGLWQQWVDFPRLLENVKRNQEILPDALQSTAGQLRLLGGNVFGSFVYPNALGAYLLLGMVLLCGGAVAMPSDRRVRIIIPALIALMAMLLASYYTGSKGALMALPAGAWAWWMISQSERHPPRAKLLHGVTFAAIVGLVVVLALATFGVLPSKPFGVSLQVRFEYWRSAWKMIGMEPLQGVGFGGFAEHYAFFKTWMGTEAKEVHNDYLQLWTELGIAGLLAYLGVWAMMLRQRFAAEPEPAVSTDHAVPGVRFEMMAIVGALLAFGFMYLSFEPLNATDLFGLLHRGDKGDDVLAGAAFAVAMPLLFGAVIIATRGMNNPGALSWAAKAAICAVLLHELIDFDIRAQAVLGAMFLLGGMFLAGTESPNGSTRFERLGRAFPLLLSLALLPVSFWIPAQSGIARASAESLEEDARELGAKAKKEEDRQKLAHIRERIVELRQEALSFTPYDSEAWVDLAFAMEAAPLEGPESVRRRAVETTLLGALERRPFSHIPPTLLGNFHAKHGEWDKAVEWYKQAAERYDRHPGLQLWLGDAYLMIGKTSRAIDCYITAFLVDRMINDTNVRMSAIFTDPRAGVFSRHTREADVFQKIERELGNINRASASGSVTFRWLTLRRIVSLCALYRDAERSKEFSTEAREQMAAEIRRTTEEFQQLVSGGHDEGDGAHAMLYVALSYEIGADPRLADQKKSKWQLARKMHAEAKRFSTDESLFERLRQNYDK